MEAKLKNFKTRYRIGVDASLVLGELTGIGKYTRELLRRLVLTDHDWYLYSHRSLIGSIEENPNIIFRSLNLSKNYSRMIWSQTILPIAMFRDNLDLFWSPSHRMPLLFKSETTAKIFTVHDLVWRQAPHTMDKKTYFLDSLFMPRLAREANRIIAVSKSTADDMVSTFPDIQHKLVVTPLASTLAGRGLDETSPRKIHDRRPFILVVGTMEPRKNHTRLIEAYSSLPRNIIDNVNLVVVGAKGWGGIDLRSVAESFSVVNNIQILGYVDENELSILYKDALFLAMPSIYEGFGLPLIESITHGTPVLTSNVASMPEVAGSAGLYVDPESVTSIRNGLFKLITDHRYRQKLSNNCNSVAKKFSWDGNIRLLMECFEAAIKERQSCQKKNNSE